MSKYRNTVFYDFKSRFIVIISGNYRHRLVWKIPFPDHFFPIISKYRAENLHFLFTGKYYSPSLCDYFRHIKLSTQSSNMFQLCLCAKVSAKVEVIGQCFFIVISFVFVKLFLYAAFIYSLRSKWCLEFSIQDACNQV